MRGLSDIRRPARDPAPEAVRTSGWSSEVLLGRGEQTAPREVTGAVVISKLEEGDRAELSTRPGAGDFRAGRSRAGNWVRVPIEGEKDLREYGAALREV